MTAYRISLAPPKLESRQYHVGVASARVLVDTPDSQVVDLNPKGADALSSRASLLANLMASSPVKTHHRAGRRGAGQPARGRRAFRDRPDGAHAAVQGGVGELQRRADLHPDPAGR